MHPAIGQPTLLVYRECVCGQWCATGEGACAPICGGCGLRMVPGGGSSGQYGGPDDPPNLGRQLRGLAFVGVLGNERALSGGLNRLLRLFGGEGWVHEWIGRSGRYFSEGEIVHKLKEMGLPTERQWTSPPWEPGILHELGSDRVSGEWLQPHTREQVEA